MILKLTLFFIFVANAGDVVSKEKEDLGKLKTVFFSLRKWGENSDVSVANAEGY